MFPSDEQLLPLIQGMAAGEKTALRSFIEQVSPMLHGVHLRATGQSVAAAVLTERSIEELWRTAPLYDGHCGRPGVWILAVARFHAVEFVDRRRGKEDRLKSTPDANVLLQSSPGTAPDPVALAALQSMDSSERDFLVQLWHRGLPGGAKGDEARGRLSELLPRWASVLSGGANDGA